MTLGRRKGFLIDVGSAPDCCRNQQNWWVRFLQFW
jgi:hypothetical protein